MTTNAPPSPVDPRKARFFGRVHRWLKEGGQAKAWKCFFCDFRARSFDELRRHTTCHEGEK